MPELSSFADADARLQALEQRIDAFDARQRVAAHHAPLLEALRKRRADLRAKIDACVARGDEWESIGYELERDMAGVQEALTDLVVQTETRAAPDAEGRAGHS
jgi:hypothetical protein